MNYVYSTGLLLVLLGFLVGCGRADGPAATNPTPPYDSVPSPVETTAPTTRSTPAPSPQLPSPQSTPTPAQDATSIVSQVIVEPATVGTSLPLSTLAAASPTPSSGTPGVVTFGDQGRTIPLHVGQTFVLQLDQLHTWDIQIADQRVLGQVSDRHEGPGAQGVYQALAPGQTTLEAQGEPICRTARPPCMLPTIVFSVTIVVQ